MVVPLLPNLRDKCGCRECRAKLWGAGRCRKLGVTNLLTDVAGRLVVALLPHWCDELATEVMEPAVRRRFSLG